MAESLINKTFIITNAIIKLTLNNKKETATVDEIYCCILELNNISISKEEIASILDILKQRCSGFFIRQIKFVNARYTEEEHIEFDGKYTVGYGLSFLRKTINCIGN